MQSAPSAGARGGLMPRRASRAGGTTDDESARPQDGDSLPHWKAPPPMRADGYVLTIITLADLINSGVVVVDRDGNLRAADFFDHEQRMRTLLRQQYAREGSVDIVEGPAPKAIRAAIEAYYDGDLTAIDKLPVKTGGTPFQREVWRLLRLIRRARRPPMASWQRGSASPTPRGRHGQWRKPDRCDRAVPPRDRLGRQPHRLWRRPAAQAVAVDATAPAFRSPVTIAEPMRLNLAQSRR